MWEAIPLNYKLEKMHQTKNKHKTKKKTPEKQTPKKKQRKKVQAKMQIVHSRIQHLHVALFLHFFPCVLHVVCFFGCCFAFFLGLF